MYISIFEKQLKFEEIYLDYELNWIESTEENKKWEYLFVDK